MAKRWLQRDAQANPDELAQALGIDPWLARHLVCRGLIDPQQCHQFLNPRLADLADPRRMADMGSAVERLCRAISTREKVALYGDYDCDGVTSTTLMCEVLRRFGLDPILHIPHRIRDGYGLNVAAVKQLRAQGVSLIVTLDCGVTAVSEVQAAVEEGVDVIVVDHHTVPVTLPKAVAVLNPHRPDCQFPYKELCAVGVAFFLCVALRAALREAGLAGPNGGPDLRAFLDVVALGTVADLVPLTGQNRLLVAGGLKVLQRAERPGIRALLDVAGIAPENADAGTLGYQLGPRINAAGRLQDAMVGVRLLLSQSMEQALPLAQELDHENRARKDHEKRTVEEALKRAAEEPVHADARALVLYDPDWHPGVVGIAAQKMVEHFHKPAILIGSGGKGSGRSIECFHLHRALAATAEHLIGFGGHAHAAGLRLDPQKLDAFRAALYVQAAAQLTPEDLVPRMQHDGQVGLEDITPARVETLQRAAPFGRGNAEPCFLICAVRPASGRVVGGHHLQLDLGLGLRGIAFRMADKLCLVEQDLDMLCSPRLETWNGRRRLSVQVKDMGPAASGAEQQARLEATP
jgi:single-stranded-DNA-specific exonuclease